MKRTKSILLALTLICVCMMAQKAFAQTDLTLPLRMTIGLEEAENPHEVSTVIQIFLLFTIISLAPSMLVMLTCFTRIVVVLSFMKRAMGTGSQPSGQILAGLALFITFYVMGPVWTDIKENAVQPFMNKEIRQDVALKRATVPLKKFMLKYTRKKDLALFIQMTKTPKPKNIKELSMNVVIPAYIISELKTAFQMGFVLFLPFLVLDMVVASVLLSMGMMMLPPVFVSMPFKILLFIMVDGWYLIIRAITLGFH